MRASQVLMRYAAGERNFRGKDLRGQSFKGQDLSGADFSGADIRGTNFSNAKLVGANFSQAKAGLQYHWTISLLTMSLLLLALSALIAMICGAYIENLLTAHFLIPNIFSGTVIIVIYVLFWISLFYCKFKKSITFTTSVVVAYLIIAIAITCIISNTIIFPEGIGKLSSSASFSHDGKPIVVNPIVGGTRGIASASFASSAFAVSIFTPAFIATIVSGSLSLAITEVILGVNTIIIAIPFIFFAINRAFAIDRLGMIITLTTQYLGGYVAVMYTPNKLKTFTTALATINSSNDYHIIARTVASLGILLSTYIARNILLGNKDYTLFLKIATAIPSIGGTSFYEADLTDTDFTQATLKSTDFRKSILTRSRLYQAQELKYIRPGITYLQKLPVRQLLITTKGENKSFEHFDLQGVNLQGAKLSGASFTGVNLNKANLQNADLSKANLKQAQLDQVNLTGACLTGSCIEDWNINSTTNLDGVVCDYVYLRENHQERRPHNGTFAPGGLAKLIQDSLETVDLIFDKGVDWKAFTYSFANTQIENEGTPLTIRSIENKGDGLVLIRVAVPPDSNKCKIHNDFVQGYEFAQKALAFQYQGRLEAKEQEINRLFYFVNQLQNQLGEVPKLMSEKSGIQQNFYGNIGNAAGNVEGDQKAIQHNYAPEQKQTLAEAAAEIQQLLAQLQTQGHSLETAQKQVASDLAKRVQSNPEAKSRLAQWSQYLGDAAASGLIGEAAVTVLKLVAQLAGIPIP